MRHPEQGDFYIEQDECLSHGTCIAIAPSLLETNSENSYKPTYVYKQPETDDEFRLMLSASRQCPLDVIKYRGEDRLLKALFDGSYSCMNMNCSSVRCICFDKYISEREKIKRLPSS